MDKNKTAMTGGNTPTFSANTADMPEKEVKTNKPNFRYVCEACSGVGFYASDTDEIKKSPSTCQTCFAPLGVIKIENFIRL